MKRKDFSKKEVKILYLTFLVGLATMYITYIPLLMDYYIIRPKESIFSFFADNDIYHFEAVIIGMALAVFYCLTLHAGVSTLIVSIALFLLTHASYIKYLNRRELLRLDDLRLTELAGMAVGYLRFELNYYLLYLSGILIFFVVAGFVLECFGGKAWKEKKRLPLKPILCARLLGVILLCASTVLYTNYFFKLQYVIDKVDPIIHESNKYVLYRFLQNDNLSTIGDNVEESYSFMLSQEKPKKTEEAAVYPNVIVIMNESWWNTDSIDADKVSFSQDPMGVFKELSDRCITGYLTSNVYGGGTVRSEIEFLTGFNAKYYLADSAYTRIKEHRFPSLADYFNGLDYETVAIHPYYGSIYNHDTAYEVMNFDKIIFAEDMLYKDIYTRYISDESLAKQIISEAAGNGGEHKFIWGVSIANHIRVLDYTAKPAEDYDYPITMDLKESELSKKDYDTLLNYVNGIYLANQAFKELVEYFSETEEPTIILMFGDHSPYFSAETLEAIGLCVEEEDWAKECLCSIPVILWSNFSQNEIHFSGESIYYLPQMLIDYAGLPDSDMTRILRYERSHFMTNSNEIVRDASGEKLHQCTSEQMQALSHFKTMQYDTLWGEGLCKDIWLPNR